ncbi:MAG: nucleoside recognition domain-containing protein [Oscillospiraceae bacterium]|nr:nucleoside recognition domain-containing protein [Oscillospiraceae bacterium]
MMKWIFSAFVIISSVCAVLLGKTEELTNSLLNEGVNAVELSFYLLGGMCVWGGIMRVADKAGITYYLSMLFKPAAKLIFKDLNYKGKAFKAMTMNIVANLLGLGNAATPFGLEAMKELEKEEKTDDTASSNMIAFTVLNTASITIIPATAASLRAKHNAVSPMDILPFTLLNSLITLVLAMTLTVVVNKFRFRKSRRNEKK